MTQHPWYSPTAWVSRGLWWLAQKMQHLPQQQELVPNSGITAASIVAAAYGMCEICGAFSLARTVFFISRLLIRAKLSKDKTHAPN